MAMALTTLSTVTVALPTQAWSAPPPSTSSSSESSDPLDAYLDSVRHDPRRLAAFARELPKGGDLHHHLLGAVRTESLIRWAAEDNRCLTDEDLPAATVSFVPCPDGTRPATHALPPDEHADGDQEFRHRVLASWSMEGFDFATKDLQEGHDHFFGAFGRFAEVNHAPDGTAHRHDADMLAEVARTAAEENVGYLETLLSAGEKELDALLGRLGDQLPEPTDEDAFGRFHATLTGNDEFWRVVEVAEHTLNSAYDGYREKLGCSDQPRSAACAVEIRFGYEVSRNRPNKRVLAEQILGFWLAERGRSHVVTLNLVEPEDHENARRHYLLHMDMLRYLRDNGFADVPLTLHAGELAPGLRGVEREDLAFHIDAAVRRAGAQRIGHGTDLAWEPADLPALLRDRQVLVEIPLTSNAQILRVAGEAHPIRRYLAEGVPIALATDDAGVSRGSLSREFQRAVEEHPGITARDLKNAIRASVEFAFVEGRSVWQRRGNYTRFVEACADDRPGDRDLSQGCRTFLRGNAKARLQWNLERELHTFTARYAHAARP
nr:adenosine deaminase [Streptoalloteichus tenebrarius]